MGNGHVLRWVRPSGPPSAVQPCKHEELKEKVQRLAQGKREGMGPAVAADMAQAAAAANLEPTGQVELGKFLDEENPRKGLLNSLLSSWKDMQRTRRKHPKQRQTSNSKLCSTLEEGPALPVMQLHPLDRAASPV